MFRGGIHSGRFQKSPGNFTNHFVDEWRLLRETEEIAWRRKDHIVKRDGSKGSRSGTVPEKYSFKGKSLSLGGKSSVNLCLISLRPRYSVHLDV